MPQITYGVHLQVEGRFRQMLRRLAKPIKKETFVMCIARYAGYFREGDRRMTILIESPEDHDGDVPLDPVRVELDAEDAEKVVEALT